MFDKLIDFIISIGKEFLPYVIVEQWNEAIMLRCGKLQQKVLKPGIHSLRIIQNKYMEQQHASFALPEMMN